MSEGKLKRYIMTRLNPEKIFESLRGDYSKEKSVTITLFKNNNELDTYNLEFRLTFSFIVTKKGRSYWRNKEYHEEPTEGYYKFKCDVLGGATASAWEYGTFKQNIVALELQEKDIPYFTKDVIWKTIVKRL